MKNSLSANYLLLVLFIVSSFLTGCSKDDEVPPAADSSGILGKWTVTAIYKDGVNIFLAPSGNDEGSYVSFDDAKEFLGTAHGGDGTYEARLDYVYQNGNFYYYPAGSWKLVSDKILRISNLYDYKIKSLTASAFHFEMEHKDLGWIEVQCTR